MMEESGSPSPLTTVEHGDGAETESEPAAPATATDKGAVSKDTDTAIADPTTLAAPGVELKEESAADDNAENATEDSAATPSTTQADAGSSVSSSQPRSAADALAPATVGGSGLLKSLDGLFGWGMGAVQKSIEVAESAAKSAVDTLKPLDARNDGALSLVLATIDPAAVNGVRMSLERVFGFSASLRAIHTAPSVATMPIGIETARKTIADVIQGMNLDSGEVACAICPFVAQFSEFNSWATATVMVISDAALDIEVEAVSQAVPIPAAVLDAFRAGTPEDYAHKDTGFAISGEAALKCDDFTNAVCGISAEQLLSFCGTIVLGRYRRQVAELHRQKKLQNTAD